MGSIPGLSAISQIDGGFVMVAHGRRWLVVLGLLAVASPLQAQFNPFNPYMPNAAAQPQWLGNPAAAMGNPAMAGSMMSGFNPYASSMAGSSYSSGMGSG